MKRLEQRKADELINNLRQYNENLVNSIMQLNNELVLLENELESIKKHQHSKKLIPTVYNDLKDAMNIPLFSN